MRWLPSLGGFLALTSTRLRSSRSEAAIDVTNGMALSVPDFLWGLVLILDFGVFWSTFYISGRVSPQLTQEYLMNFFLFESVLRLRFDL